jgi:hypothetical protein
LDFVPYTGQFQNAERDQQSIWPDVMIEGLGLAQQFVPSLRERIRKT